jgi:hypothetical protein
MVKIASADEISRRYKDSVPRVAEAYKRGVQGTTDWQERAVASQGLYEAKMADRDVLQRRAKKLAKVSNEEWRSKAADLGASRIGTGMDRAVDKQRRGFAPFREALANLTLPERTADPMTNIDNRAKGVVRVLVETKKGQA